MVVIEDGAMIGGSQRPLDTGCAALTDFDQLLGEPSLTAALFLTQEIVTHSVQHGLGRRDAAKAGEWRPVCEPPGS